MIDHLFGRPSPSWKRLQVFLVIFFWVSRILHGNPGGPRILWLRRANRILQRFTPWQLIVSTLTGVYAVRNLDKILGLGSPEPLANLYSPSYYRAIWITTGLDAGFATALPIRPKWLRDICSILFSVYYIIYATEADEKLRRFRAVPTVETLRVTWEKTTNPYIRAIAFHPRVTIRRKLLLPRPKDSVYQKPITAWLFFAPPEHMLSRATELIVDFPGGGFISMTPEHHEDRLRMWAVRTGKPVLSIEYGKAPEYPYPYPIDECFDVYRTLCESAGQIIGMSGVKMNTIFTGDSAGAHIAVAVMIKILETQLAVPHPLALQLNYAALDFNYSSWMSPQNLRILQSEQSTGNLPGLAEQKDHFKHVSPLSMVGDRKPLRRRRSWRDAFRTFTSNANERPVMATRASTPALKTTKVIETKQTGAHSEPGTIDESGSLADEEEGNDAEMDAVPEEEKPIRARVRFNPVLSEVQSPGEIEEPKGSGSSSETATNENVLKPTVETKAPLGTRLTMTSRTGYFQDRIIAPSMMRAMAILFIGPHRNPDFASDYHLSPVLAPNHLLAQFPPLLMTCGEKDPFVDDTVIFAGRLREAKRARRRELEAALAGKSAKFGEHLRMSNIEGGVRDDASVRAMRRELNELLAQTEEDWVQMLIFTDWSHGYMQMPRLMKEARVVIDYLGDWMDGVFVGQRASREPAKLTMIQTQGTSWRQRRGRGRDMSTPFTSETEMETEPEDLLTFSPRRRSPKRSGRHRSTSRNSHRTSGGSPTEDATPPANGAASLPARVASPMVQSPQAIKQVSGSPSLGAPGVVQHPRMPTPTLGAGIKVGSPSTGGQTITESELMRRRRLLDSHLLPNDTVKASDSP